MATAKGSLSDFVVEREIFRSNNGAVYRARRKRGGELVCLKERRNSELGRAKDILNEVRLLEQIDHPNVVKCFGHFFSGASLYIVLEFVDGQ